MGEWPWPGDNRTDRAQRVARAYRDALEREAPDVCRFLDRQFVDDWEQRWLKPVRKSIGEHDWISVDEAAAHVGLSVKAVYNWVYSEQVDQKRCNDGRLRVRYGSVLNHNAELRRRRAERAQLRRAS